jgi:Cof subfamily protein (haloacid dehalogenase superfamily)
MKVQANSPRTKSFVFMKGAPLATREIETVPFKLAAIDLDDTLLGPDKQVSSYNIEGIRRLQKAGVKVIIASGRAHEDCVPYHELLELDGPIVSCQGALAFEPATSRIFHHAPLSQEATEQILRQGEEHGATMFSYCEKGVFGNRSDQWSELYERSTGRQLEIVESWDHKRTGLHYKIQWLQAPEAIAAMHQKIHPKILDLADLFYFESYVIEFFSKGVSKGEALKQYATAHGLQAPDVMCFGDAHNDISMLNWAGLGVAMSHARPEVKAAANIAAPAGEPETALARAIDLVFEKYGVTAP